MKKFDKQQFAKQAMESKNTPLDHWSTDIDPAIMSGDEWVDNNEDIGHTSTENQEMEEGILPQGGVFMHPVHDVSYGKD